MILGIVSERVVCKDKIEVGVRSAGSARKQLLISKFNYYKSTSLIIYPTRRTNGSHREGARLVGHRQSLRRLLILILLE